MYQHLIEFLKKNNVTYREINHIPEGRCEIISKIRGNELKQAAKSLVVMVKHGRKERRYFLAVVPANQNVDLQAIKNFSGGDGVMLAPAERAFTLTGCEMGSVLPFSFNENLKLIVDPSLKLIDEIVFNAGRLDTSIYISTQDYFKISDPILFNITNRSLL